MKENRENRNINGLKEKNKGRNCRNIQAITLKRPPNIITILHIVLFEDIAKFEGTRNKTHYYCRHGKVTIKNLKLIYASITEYWEKEWKKS